MPVSPASSRTPSSTRAQEEFQLECEELFAEAVQLFGVPKSVGQIYGLLYASPVPLSFSDIVERLEISKGSASQGLQLLRSLAAIKVADTLKFQTGHPKSSEALTRSVAYEPELSLRKLINGVLQKQLAPLATTSTNRLTRLRELAEQVTVGNDFYLGQVKRLNVWRKRLKTVLPVLNALLGSKS